MSNTAEAQALRPHITCDSFCGKPIYDPDTDHDPSCGAPLAERARIARELRVLNIRTAADAEPEAAEDETPWRCSCGEQFTSQDDLAAHHTESGHQGMYLLEGDEEIEDPAPVEIDVEVDGNRAKVRRLPGREHVDPNPDWREKQIVPDWVYAAQRAIDQGEVTLGGLGVGKTCPGRQVIDGIEIDCPHQVAMKTIVVETCDHAKRHAKTVAEACLICGIRMLGVNLAPAGNGPLFDGAVG